VGVKLTEDESYCVLTNLRADVVTSTVALLPDAAPDSVVSVVVDQLSQLHAAGDHIAFLGVSLGGDTRDLRTVRSAPFLHWRDVPLANMLEEATALPAVVDNDLVALTKGEHWFGAGRGRERFVLLTIGAGVGYGLVMNDEVVLRPDAGVGPLGHVPLDTAGPRCYLGHRGCSTAMLTIPAITAAVSVGLGRNVEYDEALTLASGGDPVAGPIIRDAGAALGRLVAIVSTVTMTSHVILAGDGIGLADVARDSLTLALSDYRDPRADPVSLEVQTFDFTEWARAAAASAIQKWAEHPATP
jgi:predicted NBD/HSP70 family sugar kinase